MRYAGVTNRKLETANSRESENLPHRDQPCREGGDPRLFRRGELCRVTIDLATPRDESVERRDRGDLYRAIHRTGYEVRRSTWAV